MFPRSSALRRHARRALPAGRAVRWLLGLVVAGLVFELVETAFTPYLLGAGADLDLYLALMTAASAIAVARCFGRRRERGAWIAIALALVSTLVAEFYLAIRYPGGDAPYPSLADAFYLLPYPLMGAGIMLLVRGRLTSLTKWLWLDGLIAGFATGALAATVLAPAIADATTGNLVEVATNLAYPLGDLIMVFLTALGLALTGWRPDPALITVAMANVVTCVADAVYLLQVSGSGYSPGTPLDVLWPLGVLLWAVAAWQPVGRIRPPVLGARLFALPATFAAMALGIAGWFVVHPQARLGAALALGAIVLVVVRFTVTYHESVRLLERARTDSLIDPLTGLGNRRALWLHLDERAGRSTDVAMVDLDGFKAFNDRFGHAAGDVLLVRTSEQLTAAAPRAKVFRLGGDEFCVVGDLDVELLGRITLESTGPHEPGVVTVSLGVATMPDDTDDADTAMRLADERMYANKLGQRFSPQPNGTHGRVLVSDAGRAAVRA